MPLLDRAGTEIKDTFVVVGDDSELPQSGGAVFPPDRLPVEFSGPLGVKLENDYPVEELRDVVSNLSLVVLSFPSFADGRAYSQARRLRESLNFTGEIRATGDILPDQFPFMLEAGFDSFQVPDGRFPAERWAEAAQAMQFTYHRHLTRPGLDPVLALRHGA